MIYTCKWTEDKHEFMPGRPYCVCGDKENPGYTSLETKLIDRLEKRIVKLEEKIIELFRMAD